MAVDGKYGVDRAAEVLDVYQEMGRDIVGLQERGVAASLLFFKLDTLLTATVNPEATGKGRRAKVELDLLVARVSISRAEARSPEFISDRLLKVTLELCDRSRAMTFVVGYGPTDTQYDGEKHPCWTVLERIVKELPEN